MNKRVFGAIDHLVRTELRPMVVNGDIRDARVSVDRIARCCRCKISSFSSSGVIHVEAVGATRARAVRMAVQRLRDGVHGRAVFSRHPRKASFHGHDKSLRATRYPLAVLRRSRISIVETLY